MVALFLLRDMAVKQTMNQELFLLLFKRKKEEKKRKPRRVQEALWDFLLFFLWTKTLAGKAVKLHFIQLVWHQAPGQERKCTIKCDLLERRRAKGLWKRRGAGGRARRKKKNREREREGGGGGGNDMLMKSTNDSEWRETRSQFKLQHGSRGIH